MNSFVGSAVAVAALLAGNVAASPIAEHALVERATYNHTALVSGTPKSDYYVSLGPRPYYIINNMTASPLKTALQQCENGPFKVTDFTIGHRGGGTLQFPEETVESTMAGMRMGAGILECDVSFTGDRGLVCRHSLCDLHTTTNILLKPELAKKCTVPFTPANATSPANALCCTSDITTAEYLTLCGKQDGFNASAKNVQDYQYGTPTWRTELYDTCGTVMTLDSYITLVDSAPGYRNFTPELKTPPAAVPMPFKGYTQEQYARDMIETFIRRGIDPARVWAQSFNPPDIYQWIKEYPAFGKQALFLDEDGDDYGKGYDAAVARLPDLKARGVNIISPPINYLVALGGPQNKTYMPSKYALAAKAAGLDIVAWTFERSGPLATVKARSEYYFGSVLTATYYDGQLYEFLDVLGRQIGIKAIFTDWASTVTFYANCFGLTGPKASDYKAFTSTTSSTKPASTSTKPASSTSTKPASTTSTKPASTTTKPVSQISDGQVQIPKATSSAKPVSQISDGQVQAPKATSTAPRMISQIADGQIQAPKVTQISDGQVQAPKTTGA